MATALTDDSKMVEMDSTHEIRTAYGENSDVRWRYHSLMRYYQRTPNNTVPHDRAWRNGIGLQYALPYFRHPTYNTFPQAARMYDHGSCVTIMVVKDNVVQTVLLLDLIKDSAIKTYLRSLLEFNRRHHLEQKTDMWGEDVQRVRQINRRERE